MTSFGNAHSSLHLYVLRVFLKKSLIHVRNVQDAIL